MPAGRAVVFDKFLPDHDRLTTGRRLLNLGSALFGTDITRRFSDLGQGVAGVQVVKVESSLLCVMYRVKLIQWANIQMPGSATAVGHHSSGLRDASKCTE